MSCGECTLPEQFDEHTGTQATMHAAGRQQTMYRDALMFTAQVLTSVKVLSSFDAHLHSWEVKQRRLAAPKDASTMLYPSHKNRADAEFATPAMRSGADVAE